MVRRGYTLQFARRPPRFRGVLATTVRSENAQVLRAEVMNLLEKGAIEIVPPAQSSYSQAFTATTSSSPKRRQPVTYSRSQTTGLHPDEKVDQDDHFETDPPAYMPRGLVLVRGEQDVRRADPFASFIQRHGYKTSKVHSGANRNNTSKTRRNPRASVGRRSANNIQQDTAKGKSL